MGQAITTRVALAARHPATIIAMVLAISFAVAVLVHPATWASFTALAGGDKETLRSLISSFGPFAPLASILMNVAQGVLAPIPGFVVPFVNGAVFGTWGGMLVTWIGGVAAASTCFMIARTFGRGFAQRMCGKFKVADEINRKLEKHAFMAILLARFVPGVPFDLLSYFVGLTRVRYVPFAVATAIGSAPHAYVYALMGSHLQMPLWLGVLMTPALGLVILTVKWLIATARGSRDRDSGRPATLPARAGTPSTLRPAPGLSAWRTIVPAADRCTTRRPATTDVWRDRSAVPIGARRQPVRN